IWPPKPPKRSEHPGEAVALLDTRWSREAFDPRRDCAGAARARMRPRAPGSSLGGGGAGPPRGQEADELGTLPEPPREHAPVPRHLARNREELPRSEIEASVERLHGVEDLGMGEVRVAQRAPLNAPPVDELAAVEPALLEGLSVHRRARVGRGDRHLDRVRIELAGEADRLRDRLVRLAGKPEDERAVDPDAERLGVPGELPRDVQADPLLHVVEDALVAGFVADEQKAKAVVFQDTERLVRDVRLGVARPCDAEPTEPARDRLGVTWSCNAK